MCAAGEASWSVLSFRGQVRTGKRGNGRYGGRAVCAHRRAGQAGGQRRAAAPYPRDSETPGCGFFLFRPRGGSGHPDSRFPPNAGELDQDKIYYTPTGAGVGYTTAVGAAAGRAGVQAQSVAAGPAIPPGRARGAVDRSAHRAAAHERRRRFHLHFSIGSTF